MAKKATAKAKAGDKTGTGKPKKPLRRLPESISDAEALKNLTGPEMDVLSLLPKLPYGQPIRLIRADCGWSYAETRAVIDLLRHRHLVRSIPAKGAPWGERVLWGIDPGRWAAVQARLRKCWRPADVAE